jgi:hypothetical protein
MPRFSQIPIDLPRARSRQVRAPILASWSRLNPRRASGNSPAFRFDPLCVDFDALLLLCNALATAGTFLPNVRKEKS